MNRVITILACMCLAAGTGSCNQKKKDKQQEFIDIASYLKGQLKYIDSVPHGYLKINVRDSLQPDSVYLTLQQVKDLAAGFLVPELELKKFSKRFEETSFADATLQSITVTYTSVNKNNSVERVDVYVNPQNGEIARVYLVQNTIAGDNPVKKQLLWTHNKGFTIITTHSGNGQTDSTITEQVIWQ